MNDLKDRIRAARKHAGLTQEQLAQKVGQTQGMIADLERGRRSSSTKLVEIAGATGINPVWLATGKGSMLDKALVAEEPQDTYNIGNREKILLDLFSGLTQSQQDEVIRRLSLQKHDNDALLAELLLKRQA